MKLYVDTSDLFKLYVEESGSRAIEALAATAETMHTSRVAYAEFRGSVARARRNHRVSEVAYKEAVTNFENSWLTYSISEVTEPLVSLAGDLAAKHFLRGFDAIHLASAVTLQHELGEPMTFSAADERLMEAARAEGLLVAYA
jgi:predicted nucleic acid-binding protein